MAWVEIEKTVGPAGSVDLITVAQALHWFEFDDFFAVVRKVSLQPLFTEFVTALELVGCMR
jgi:hypothetical protein